MENKNERPILPISWGGWFVGSFIAGFFTGFFNAIFSQVYGYSNIVAIIIVSIFLVLSIILGLITLRELVAEAHVRALEVFYGKKRIVAKMEDTQNKNKDTTNWVKSAIKNLADYD